MANIKEQISEHPDFKIVLESYQVAETLRQLSYTNATAETIYHNHFEQARCIMVDIATQFGCTITDVIDCLKEY